MRERKYKTPLNIMIIIRKIIIIALTHFALPT